MKTATHVHIYSTKMKPLEPFCSPSTIKQASLGSLAPDRARLSKFA